MSKMSIADAVLRCSSITEEEQALVVFPIWDPEISLFSSTHVDVVFRYTVETEKMLRQKYAAKQPYAVFDEGYHKQGKEVADDITTMIDQHNNEPKK